MTAAQHAVDRSAALVEKPGEERRKSCAQCATLCTEIFARRNKSACAAGLSHRSSPTWLARAPARPIGNRMSIWRWADGKRSRRIGVQLALGRALRVMLPALTGDGGIEAGASWPARSRGDAGFPHGTAVTAPDQGNAFLGTRFAVGDRRDSRRCALNGARHRARAGDGGVPPGHRRQWERAHSLVEPGSRQRLLEGRRTAREGVPAPLAFLRGRGGER